jgi:cytochrome c oxidase assembly factor 2
MEVRGDKVAEIQRAWSRQKRASRIRFVNIELQKKHGSLSLTSQTLPPPSTHETIGNMNQLSTNYYNLQCLTPCSANSSIEPLCEGILIPTMPPHLHPRSRFTSSLFATTLFASFFVVALPHVLPCPAPRLAYADGEMPDGTPQRRRRRRKCVGNDGEQSDSSRECQSVENGRDENMALSRAPMPMPKRECPVPKPGGLVGEILGFKPPSTNEDGKGRPP